MLSFYISDTTDPQQGKSSPIQKGLIPDLQSDAADLCGEGLGFGTPILQYRRDFYFPGAATVKYEEDNREKHWTKVFTFNLIERKQQDSLSKISAFSWMLPRLHNWVYKKKTGRQLLKLITILSRPGYQRTSKHFAPQLFIPVQSRGESPCQFLVSNDDRILDIELSFDAIARKNLQNIYIANELGGHQFIQYHDDSGLFLTGNQIEPWAKIEGRWGTFFAPKLDFGFRVEIPKGITAFRGREVFESKDIFWSGILLQLPKETTIFRYRVHFGNLPQILGEG